MEHSVVSKARLSLEALVWVERHRWSRSRFPNDHALLAGEQVEELSSWWPQVHPETPPL